MRGVQDPATNNTSTEKVLLEQLAQASRVGQVPPPGAHNIDPAIAGHPAPSAPPAMMDTGGGVGIGDGMDDADGSPDKKGLGKRELSTSKRAAQNRAAQRAFRMRKESHIKKLEEQVRDYSVLAESYKRLQGENYALRDYIISLQSRLIESQGEFPQPPINIDLHAPREEGLPVATASAQDGAPAAAPTAQMNSSDLQASAAQAVARGQQQQQDQNESSIEQRTDPALTDA